MRYITGISVLLMGVLFWLLFSFSAPSAASLQADPTATPEPSPTPAAVAGESTALVIVVSTADNEPPRADSTIMIFDGDEAVAVGETVNGTYRAVLPEGSYDIVLLHGSMPDLALLSRDVDVSGSDTVTLTLAVPAEDNVTFSVRTPNGNPPKNGYTIVVSSNGVELASRTERPLGSGDTGFVLRSDISYDVLVQYNGEDILERDISPSEDSEFTIITPGDEGTVDIFLLDDGEPLTGEAQVVVIDDAGYEFLPNTEVSDSHTVYLPAGAVYRVIGQYEGVVSEDSVTIEAGGLHPVTLDFSAQTSIPSYEEEETAPDASSG